MTNKELEKLIKVCWDMHVHVGSDVLPRKYSVASLAAEETGRIAGLAVKSHAFSTQPAVMIEQGMGRKIGLVGAVTLNNFVGGLNPDAVYASATIKTKFPCLVWFPTIHAENHVNKSKGDYEIPPDWVKDHGFTPRKKIGLSPIKALRPNGQLNPRAESVLRMIKKLGCVLATGHLSWQEARVLAERALAMGIKVILTHVSGRDIIMPLKIQKELAQKGAFVEYCYIFWLDRDSPGDYSPGETAANIKAIGPEQCLISSDTGQTRNPCPSECLKAWVKLLEKHGLKKDDFYQMLVKNPQRILR